MPMAVQSTPDHRTKAISNYGMIACILFTYIVFSYCTALLFVTFVQSYLFACVLSFASVGIVFGFIVQMALPEETSHLETRLLHELAKRRLVVFES